MEKIQAGTWDLIGKLGSEQGLAYLSNCVIQAGRAQRSGAISLAFPPE